jgi:alkane 1-monooxygenase
MGATMGGSNINVAHELLHKDNLVDKLTGMLTLSKCFYMHFVIEHVFGHHRNVATPKDPATARKGETVYSFYFKSVFGSYISSWKLECKRVKAIYGISTPFNRYNRMLWYQLHNY